MSSAWVIKTPCHPGPPPEPPVWNPSPFDVCDCSVVEIRSDRPNGREQFAKQCLRCGANKGWVYRGSPEIKTFLGIKPFDHGLAEEWIDRMTHQERMRRLEWDAAQAANRAARKKWYAAYIACPEWAKLRAKVLERDRFICQGCGERAVQAHHKTYERIGYELLMDLIAVCESCHKRLHPGWV